MHAPAHGAVSLIVNGDDFGASPAVNAALMRCHREGILTSASVLVNRPATDEALALARACPSLGIGVHLNLTDGLPLSPPIAVPSLVDRAGRFRAFPTQLLRVVGGHARLAEVEREFRAQIENLLARGVVPTHLDGHMHVHAYPRLLPIALRLMNEYGIRGMRQPALSAWAPLYLDIRHAARGRRASRRHSPRWQTHTPWSTAARHSWASITTSVSRRGSKAALVAHSRAATVDFLLDAATFLRGQTPPALLAPPSAASAVERSS